MSQLTRLQDEFQNYLLHSSNQIHQHIVDTRKVSAETRLAIYSNAYRARLLEALIINYPVLSQYLGEEDFEKLGNEYIDAYPSTYRSIRWFGDKLSQFLRASSHYSSWPFLSELAQFEWAMTLAFDAADSTLLQLEEVGRVPPDAWVDMRFQAQPSAQRLNLKWNVVSIWQALTDDQEPNEPQESFSVSWILWRKDFLTQFCSLSLEEAWAIDAMLNGSTFGDICEGLCQWVDEQNAAMHGASLLKGWITAGLLTKVI